MKIHILGATGSGCSPFAKMLGEKLGIIQVISASEWLNNLYIEPKLLDKQQRLQVLTDLTLHELRKNKDSCLNFIKEKYSLSEPCIIEGIRNPNDFIQLFEPTKDIVIFLNRAGNPYTTNSFEQGIILISNYIDWLANISLLDFEKRINFLFDISELPDVVDNFVKLYEYKNWCKFCGSGGGCSCNKK